MSLAIDGYYEKSQNYNLSPCEITLLPRLEIGEELLVPIATCTRLMEFKQAIEQDEQREETRRNYVPSPVLTEAELYLRLETIWWLDKITWKVSTDATREKVKESNDELGGVDDLDLDNKDDSGDGLDICNADATREKVKESDDVEGEDASSDAVELGNEHLGIEDLQLLGDEKAMDYFKDEHIEKLDGKLENNTDEEIGNNTDDGGSRQEDAIRESYKDGETLEALAEEYDLPLQEIFKLVDNVKLPDGITQEGAENNERQQEETDRKVRRCELYEIRKEREDNSKKQIVLCWYYE